MKAETLQTATAILAAAIPDKGERAEVLAMLKPTPDRRDKMLTTGEAAKLAGVHRKTLFAWEDKGYLKPRRITPSRVRWSRNELETFLCETA
jgi:predicted DNA-binding transcriptional regulator AlpA